MRFFGWIPDARTSSSVATKFVHLRGLPLWPIASELVDTASIYVERGKERSLFSRTYVERTSYRSSPLPLDRRSIMAAYLRSWGLVAAMVGIARFLPEPVQYTTMFFGFGAFAIGLLLGEVSMLALSQRLVIVGLGAAIAPFAAMFVPWPIAIVLALLAIPAWRSIHWERGGIAVPIARVIERRPVDNAERGAPPLAPLQSVAPAHVERVVDQPRTLT